MTLSHLWFAFVSCLKQGLCSWLAFVQLWLVFCRQPLHSGLTFFLFVLPFLLCVRASRWGKDVARTCGSSFLSHFGGRSLSSQLDASAIMSLVILKGNFERIACLLPPQHLKRTRGRFKCVPQRLTAYTSRTIFLYRC